MDAGEGTACKLAAPKVDATPSSARKRSQFVLFQEHYPSAD